MRLDAADPSLVALRSLRHTTISSAVIHHSTWLSIKKPLFMLRSRGFEMYTAPLRERAIHSKLGVFSTTTAFCFKRWRWSWVSLWDVFVWWISQRILTGTNHWQNEGQTARLAWLCVAVSRVARRLTTYGVSKVTVNVWKRDSFTSFCDILSTVLVLHLDIANATAFLYRVWCAQWVVRPCIVYV